MGGTGSGRKSVKGQAVKLMLDVQIALSELLYDDLESNLTRDQLKDKVKEKLQDVKQATEELERA